MIKLFYLAKRELHFFFFFWFSLIGFFQWETSDKINLHIILIKQGCNMLQRDSTLITCQSRFTLRPSLPSLPSFPSFPSLPSFPFSRGAIFLTKLSSHIGSNSKGFASSDFFESDITSYKKKEKKRK